MSSAGGNALLWLIGTLALLVVALVVGVLWMTAVPGRSHVGSLPPLRVDCWAECHDSDAFGAGRPRGRVCTISPVRFYG